MQEITNGVEMVTSDLQNPETLGKVGLLANLSILGLNKED